MTYKRHSKLVTIDSFNERIKSKGYVLVLYMQSSYFVQLEPITKSEQFNVVKCNKSRRSFPMKCQGNVSAVSRSLIQNKVFKTLSRIVVGFIF